MINPQHYKALFKLGLPIVIGQLGMIVLGFADTLMIGHHSTEDLAAASFVNNMFNLVIGQLGMIVLGFADTLMIGHHSTEDLAAASFVNNMFNLVIIFATGFSYGLTPIVGSLFGKGEKKAVGCTLKNALWANGLIGILLTAIMGILYLNIHRLANRRSCSP